MKIILVDLGDRVIYINPEKIEWFSEVYLMFDLKKWGFSIELCSCAVKVVRDKKDEVEEVLDEFIKAVAPKIKA